MSGTLWLVRHGHTVVHATGGVAGRSDVPLSATGRTAVRALGRALARELDGGSRAPRWYASPLERTRDSAAILRAALGQGERPLVLDARLVELDFGDWEGSTWEDVHREEGEALAAWGEDWVARAPPNGESFAAQAARCGRWLDEAVGDGEGDGDGDGDRGGVSAGEDVIVVAHGGSIRALACRLLDWPLAEAMRLRIDPATVCRFERDARLAGGWRLAGANIDDFG